MINKADILKGLKSKRKKPVKRVIGLPENYTVVEADYVSDGFDTIQEMLKNGSLSIVAGCGMGKTYFTTHFLMEKYKVLVVNFLNVVGYQKFNRVKKRTKQQFDLLGIDTSVEFEQDYHINSDQLDDIDGSCSKEINICNLSRLSQKKNILDKFDFVVIDEIQKLIKDEGFRQFRENGQFEVIADLAKRGKLITLTGTPINIENILHIDNHIVFHKKHLTDADVTKIEIKCISDNSENLDLNELVGDTKNEEYFKQYLENYPTESLNFLNELNNLLQASEDVVENRKSVTDDYLLDLKRECIENNWYLVVYSNRNHIRYRELLDDSEGIGYFKRDIRNETSDSILNENLLTSNVTVATCVIKEGLDLDNVDKPIVFFVDLDNEKGVTPDDIIQLANRARKQTKRIILLTKDLQSVNCDTNDVREFGSKLTDIEKYAKQFYAQFNSLGKWIEYFNVCTHKLEMGWEAKYLKKDEHSLLSAKYNVDEYFDLMDKAFTISGPSAPYTYFKFLRNDPEAETRFYTKPIEIRNEIHLGVYSPNPTICKALYKMQDLGAFEIVSKFNRRFKRKLIALMNKIHKKRKVIGRNVSKTMIDFYEEQFYEAFFVDKIQDNLLEDVIEMTTLYHNGVKVDNNKKYDKVKETYIKLLTDPISKLAVTLVFSEQYDRDWFESTANLLYRKMYCKDKVSTDKVVFENVETGEVYGYAKKGDATNDKIYEKLGVTARYWRENAGKIYKGEIELTDWRVTVNK